MAPLQAITSFYGSLFKSLFTLVFARLYTPQKPPKHDLTGKYAIVTGANSGIGLSIATSLVRQGATVFLACRSLQRGEAAINEIVSKTGENSKCRIQCWALDTSNLSSVRDFCDRWVKEGKKVDILVHNAGISSPPEGSTGKTKDGMDLVYVTNYLGSFLMTRLLEDHLSETARIVFTSSTGHYNAGPTLFKGLPQTSEITNSAPAYAHSKGQQVLLAHLLQERFSAVPGNRKMAHSFTPGFTSTPIFGKYELTWKMWLKNPLFASMKAFENVAVDTDEGAQTGVWLATADEHEILPGGSFWEWMTRRTSLVDYIAAKMGPEVFKARCQHEWKTWEKDAGVEWAME